MIASDMNEDYRKLLLAIAGQWEGFFFFNEWSYLELILPSNETCMQQCQTSHLARVALY